MSLASFLRLLVVMTLWATCFPLITIGLDLAPHLAFAALRAAFAGLCLLFIGTFFGRSVPRSFHSWLLIGAAALGTTSLGFFGMFHAAEYVSPGLATVIANTQPILAAILAHAFLGERLKGTGKFGLFVGLLGIVTIALPGIVSGNTQGQSVGIAFVALAATGVAGGNIAIKQLAGHVDAVMAMGFQLVLGAFPLALLSLLTEDISTFSWSMEFLATLLLLSVFGTALAFWLWFATLEQIGLNRANAFTFLVPILALAIGATLFEEQLDWIQIAGTFLVLSGIMLVERDGSTSGTES